MAYPDSIWNRILSPDAGDLPSDVAKFFLSLDIPEQDQERYHALVAKEHVERTRDEQLELEGLVHANTVLMLLQAKARMSLKEQQPAA
jgi:hypothetical protein